MSRGQSVLFHTPYEYRFGTVPYSLVAWDGQAVRSAMIVGTGYALDHRHTYGQFQIWSRSERRGTCWYVVDTQTAEVARVNRNNTTWADLKALLQKLSQEG